MTEPSGIHDHSQQLLGLADHCVKCGLCLPHCPTYALTRNEAESPRGRIALAEGLARGALPAGKGLVEHLDNCLLCRRCESACPSGVRFAALMDHARAVTLSRRPRRLRLAAAILSRRRLAALGLRLSVLLPASWLPGGGALARAARHLARRSGALPSGRLAADGPRVGLFRGCVGAVLQPSALRAAELLLRAAGATVVDPPQQGCCGAMHGHLGDAAAAARLAESNRNAFTIPDLSAIVSVASGCGSQLSEQQPPLPAPHQDISDYLLSSGLIDRLRFRPLHARALLHTPCSLAATPGRGAAVAKLLAHIAGLQLTPLDAGPGCCGAAGLHLISHGEQGEALREPKLVAIAAAAPDLLITSNPGCAAHLLAGLDKASPEVLHPVELLARQLITAQPDGATGFPKPVDPLQ
jgi:glycolate oxidase iron-sulfur subunit